MRIIITAIILMLFAAPAIARDWPIGSGGGDKFDACRGGATAGGGLDAATGLYAWTCGNFNWNSDQPSASYMVNCTGDGTGTVASTGADAGKDAYSCLRSGEKRLIGALHRIGMAVDRTADGGTVYLPRFSGKHYGIYVDDGCGTLSDGTTRADCPNAYLANLRQRSDWSITGPHVMRFKIQVNRGITLEGEGTPHFVENDPGDSTVTPDTPKFTGVHIVIDRGNNFSSFGTTCAGSDCRTPDGPDEDIEFGGYSIVMGGNDVAGASYCSTTSSSDSTCVPATEDGTQRFFSVGITPYGITSSITDSNMAAGTVTVSNSISGTTEATYTGVCSGNRLIRCGDSSGVSGVARTSHGCDFGADGGADDFGTCEGFADALETDLADGKEYILGFDTTQCYDNPASSSECDGSLLGHHIYLGGARAIGGSELDATRAITMGYNAGNVTQRSWPLPYGDYVTGAGTEIREVYVLDPNTYFQGGRIKNIGISPANWILRDSATAAAKCLSGSDVDTTDDEAACDTTTLLGFGQGANTEADGILVFNGSQPAGQASNVDTRGQGMRRRIANSRFFNRRRGAWFDLCSTLFVENTVANDKSVSGNASAAFVFFCQDVLVSNNFITQEGAGSSIFQQAQNSRNLEISNNVIQGTKGNPLFQLGAGNGLRISGNQIMGNEGTVVMVDAGNPVAIIKGLSIVDNQISGRMGTATGTSTTAILIRADKSGTTLADAIESLTIERNLVSSESSNMCGVWIEADSGSDAAALVDESRPQIKMRDNAIDGTGSRWTCVGSYETAGNNQDASETSEIQAERYQPVLIGNSANGVFEPDQPYSSVAAADVDDCENLGLGTVVAIHDDTAAGACTDADANGVLDGGGTARSICWCDPAGDTADGAWTAAY